MEKILAHLDYGVNRSAVAEFEIYAAGSRTGIKIILEDEGSEDATKTVAFLKLQAFLEDALKTVQEKLRAL
ncbi:hypothetical protein ACRAWG_05895 [Methylobacterium sp. P31]